MMPDRDALVASILAARWPDDGKVPQSGTLVLRPDAFSAQVAGILADQIIADHGGAR